jgi:hypothetical protein
VDEIAVDADWRGNFVLARETVGPANSRDLQRLATAGVLIRLVRGVYVRADVWAALDPVERHIWLLRAVLLLRERRLVFAYRSAAAIWGLPLLGPPPEDAHTVTDRSGGGRSDDRLVRHCVDRPSTAVVIGALELTPLARTVIDVALGPSFPEAVMMADAALAGLDVPVLGRVSVSRHELRSELPPPGSRGVARARRVVEFADGRAGSPMESGSRASIATAGLSMPELQHEFRDAEGRMFTDFWWSRWGIAGEMDGRSKYLDPRYRNGRTLEQVLLDEKHREARLRRLPEVKDVVRWGSDVALSPLRLGALLRSAGVC